MRLFFLAMSCSLLAIGCRSYPSDQKDIVQLRQEILDWEESSFINDAELTRLNQEVIAWEQLYSETDAERSALKTENKELKNSESPSEDRLKKDRNQTGSTQPPTDVATALQVVYNAPVPTLAAPEPALKLRTAASISIDSSATVGVNLDKIEGDEGVEIFITPQDDTGETVHCDGELTVSLIDPTATPERQRIGLWKFVSEETKLFFANTPSGERGILLHLPWEQTIPINNALDLHVRLITTDGRALKTKHQLTITPPDAEYSVDDSGIRRWTREDPRWLPASDASDGVAELREPPNVITNKTWKPSKKPPTMKPPTMKPPTRAKQAKVENSPTSQTLPEKPVWSPIRK